MSSRLASAAGKDRNPDGCARAGQNLAADLPVSPWISGPWFGHLTGGVVSFSSRSRGSSRAGLLGLLATLASLAIVPAAHAATTSLFDLNVPGPQVADSDTDSVEVGVRLTVTSSFRAQGIAVYRAPGHPITSMRAHLWEGDRLVATALTGSSTPKQGWVRADFVGGPRTLVPGTEYVTSYTAERGEYVATTGFFADPLAVAGSSLRAPVDAGVYRYLNGGIAQQPTEAWDHSNYWVTPYGEGVPDAPPAPPSTGPWALFDRSTPIANQASDDPDRVEVGVRFSVDAPPQGKGYRTSTIRFYRATSAGMMENRVRLYDQSGTLVADGMAMGEGPATGVIDAWFGKNVTLTPGQIYTASYVADGHYAEDQQGFAIPREAGPVNFPAEAGVYEYGGGFPTNTWNAADYYVSPIVESYPLPEWDFTAPTVKFDNYADNAVVAANTSFLINIRSTDPDSPEYLKAGRILVDGVLRISTTQLVNNGVKGYYVTLTPGAHTIVAEVDDPAGNVGRAGITLNAIAQ
jgi:hypothetical protein